MSTALSLPLRQVQLCTRRLHAAPPNYWNGLAVTATAVTLLHSVTEACFMAAENYTKIPINLSMSFSYCTEFPQN